MASRFTKYTKNYIDGCFAIWYGSGRKEISEINDEIPVDEHGRKPPEETVRMWRNKYMWDAIADDLDNKAVVLSATMETGLVRRKAEMLNRQADLGFKLQQAGWEYLEHESFDSAASAVQAIKLGMEMERTSRGVSDLMIKMGQMTDEELEAEIFKRMEQAAQAGQIVDVEEVGNEESVGESSNQATTNDE